LRLRPETVLGPLREQLDLAAGEATCAQTEGEIVAALELIERADGRGRLTERLADLDGRAGVIEQRLRTLLTSVDGIDRSSVEEISASVERIVESVENEAAPEATVMEEVRRLLEASRQHSDTWEQLRLAETHLSDAHRALAGRPRIGRTWTTRWNNCEPLYGNPSRFSSRTSFNPHPAGR
jgi:methyl-accepting chemotaxis protein